MSPPTSLGGAWIETVLYSFMGGDDGATPTGSLLRTGNGVLYGTTEFGGANGTGVAFELIPPSSPGGTWTEKVIHTFGGTGDDTYPVAGLTYSSGLLYTG